MMGQTKRVRRSVGSWLGAVALAASACGGTSVGQPTPGAGANGSVEDGPPLFSGVVGCPATQPQSGAACVDLHGFCRYGSDDCSASIVTCMSGGWAIGYHAALCPPAGGSGGGSPGSGGGFSVAGGAPGVGSSGGAPPTMTPPIGGYCPASVPVSGTACVKDPRGGPWQCEYGPDTGCGAILASCNAGVWSLGGYAVDCTGGVAGTGGEGGEGPIPDAGAGPGPDPMVDCPVDLPAEGAYCYKPSSVTSYRCDYPSGCAGVTATCSGTWQHTSTWPCDGAGP